MGYEYKGKKLPLKKEWSRNGYYKMDWPQELKNLVDGQEVDCAFYFAFYRKEPIFSSAIARVVGDYLEFDVKEKIFRDVNFVKGVRRSSKELTQNPRIKLEYFLERLNSAKENRYEYVFKQECIYTEIWYEEDGTTVKHIQQNIVAADRDDCYSWNFVEPGIEEKIIEAYDKAFEKNFYKVTNNKKAYYKTTLKEIGLDIDKMVCPDWF